jgi:hypothetical protein
MKDESRRQFWGVGPRNRETGNMERTPKAIPQARSARFGDSQASI